MPIEIKVLKQFGQVPAGTYPARYLKSSDTNFVMEAFNPCKSAQIIDGPHSGEILPYHAYIVTGELPAQADLLKVKEKLINDLTAAGQNVAEYARKTGRLQQTVEILEEEKRHLGSRIDSLEKTNAELNELIEVRNWAVDELNKELEALQQDKGRPPVRATVELPKKVAQALDWSFHVAGRDWTEIVHDSFMCFHTVPQKRAITDFAADNFPDFLRALVNGYTAETGAEKDEVEDLRKEIESIIVDTITDLNHPFSIRALPGPLTEKIYDFIQQRQALPF